MLGIDWVTPSSDRRDRFGKGRADEDFPNLVQDFFLTQFVDKPTRGSTVLDLLLSDDPNMAEEVEVGEHLGASDHNIVCVKILFRVRVQYNKSRANRFQEGKPRGYEERVR